MNLKDLDLEFCLFAVLHASAISVLQSGTAVFSKRKRIWTVRKGLVVVP